MKRTVRNFQGERVLLRPCRHYVITMAPSAVKTPFDSPGSIWIGMELSRKELPELERDERSLTIALPWSVREAVEFDTHAWGFFDDFVPPRELLSTKFGPTTWWGRFL